MPKKPLTPGAILARIEKAHQKQERLEKSALYLHKRLLRLKRLLAMSQTLTLDLGLQEDTNASA
jgi:hypothetical protein